MKAVAIAVIAVVLVIPMSSAFASWHWSSPFQVCGMDVIKKGEKCDLESEESVSAPVQMETLEKSCKDGFKEIIKKTTNKVKCVKESSFEKLILRGWGLA